MKFKSTFLQDYLLSVLIGSIIASSLIAQCGIVWIAMLAGYLIGMIGARMVFNKQWFNTEFRQLSTMRKYAIASIPALIGSQMAWVALLV